MKNDYFGYQRSSNSKPQPTSTSPWKTEHHPFFKRHVCSAADHETGKLLWYGYSVALRSNQNKPAMHTPQATAATYAELVRRLSETEKQLKRY